MKVLREKRTMRALLENIRSMVSDEEYLLSKLEVERGGGSI